METPLQHPAEMNLSSLSRSFPMIAELTREHEISLSHYFLN